MDSNTYSAQPPTGRPAGSPDEQPAGLAALTAALDELDGQDLDRLSDVVRAERVPALRQLTDRLEGQWLKELAGVDAHRAAGADQDQPARSTASWLRNRLRMGAGRPIVRSGPPGRCSAGPFPRPPRPWGRESCRWPTPRCWSTAPTTCPTTSPPRPNRSWSRRPAGWIRRGYARPSDFCWRSRTLRVPTPPANAAMRAGGCGCHRPSTTWSPSTGCWRPKPARPCRPPWNPWPAQSTPTTVAVGASGPPTP